MNKLLELLTDKIGLILIGIIEFCLKNMFTEINDSVNIAVNTVLVGPMQFMPDTMHMIRYLSENVLLPISSVIISMILSYELISMIMDRNGFREMDSSFLFRFLFKAAVAVFLLSKSYEITRAIFDVGAYLVAKTGAYIVLETDLSVNSSLLDIYKSSLADMSFPELLITATYTFIDSLLFKILSVLIIVVSYGRIIEIYLMIAIAPIAFATLGNKEWGQIGINYIKGLIALAFQGFLIMLIVGIYSSLVTGLVITEELEASMVNLLIMAILFFFALFKTAGLSKQIFNVR